MNVFELKTIIILAAISAGTVLIYLGYRLYALGIRELGDAEVSMAHVKLRLLRFGPGVVLALFGAGLIVFGITRDFRSTTSTTVTKALPNGGTVSIEAMNAENAIYQIETMNNVAAATEEIGNSGLPANGAGSSNAPQRNR